MTTHIQFHRSNIAGATPDVSYMFVGEPAVNLYDKKLWVKGISGDLILFIDGTTGERVAGSNTEIQFKDANGFSASGKLVFDGHGLSADGATFHNDIVVNDILIGKGGGSNNSFNVAIGQSALQDNTTGGFNTAIGAYALDNNTTGVGNVAVGTFALTDSGTGDNNTAIGTQALKENDDGSHNTAIGTQSILNNTRGVKNTAVGYRSLYSAEHEVVSQSTPTNFANCNTAIGYESGYLGITADYNTGVGFRSLYLNDGHSNTALGASAGFGIRTGSKNTALGASAGSRTVNPDHTNFRISGQNNTFLGHASEPSSQSVSNEITLGDTNVDTIRTGNDGFSISTTHGISAEGATFGGDVVLRGNLLLPEDGSVGIGGDTEKISFNGSGPGSSSIDIEGAVVDFGVGGGCDIRSHGDTDTMLKFVNDHHGSGNDSIQLKQSNTVMVQVNPIDVNVAGTTFHGGGATFGGDVHFGGNLILPEDGEVQIGGDTEKIIFNGGSAIINLFAGQVSVGSGGGNGYIQSYGDNDTNMRYQADQWTLKVGGTDYIDVTTAGTNFADTDVVRPNLKDYSETVNEIGTITGDTAVSFADGNVQTVTGNGDCLFTFTYPPASGKAGTLTMIITNGGANATTWHSSVKWPGDNAPALTASGVDVVSFMTIDAGTTIYGFVGGINFS